jgi:hypothetical protein
MLQKEIIFFMLAEYYEKGEDFMDSLLPFIEYCLANDVPEKITASSLRDIVEKQFPFEYNLATYECIIEKFVAKGILTPFVYDGVAYYYPSKGLKKHDIDFKRIEILHAIDAITQEFCLFAEKLNREFLITEAQELIFSFLIKHLEQVLSPQPMIDLSSLEQLNDDETILCLFLIEQFESETVINQYLKTVIKGIVCYTYIYFKDDKDLKKDLSSLKVFLDTPLIIYALGYAGELRKQLADELINQIKTLKAEVYCFEHSLREIRDILTACDCIIKNRLPGVGAIRFTVEYFLSKPDPLTQIYLAGINLESDIEDNAKIKIFKDSLYELEDKSFFIDEKELTEKIADGMIVEDQDYERAAADAKSINLTNYLRENKKNITELSDAKAIFVTKNRMVVKVSADYLGESRFEIPTTFHYTTLTALLLLSYEINEPKLPLVFIIENCYAAVAPGNSLWASYIKKLNKSYEEGEMSKVDYFKFRSQKYSRKPLLLHKLKHLPDSVIDLEEIKRLDEERIAEESRKAREEERQLAEAEVSKIKDENAKILKDKEEALSERDKVLNKINNMKKNKGDIIKSRFKIFRFIFLTLFVTFSLLSIFTILPLVVSILLAVINGIATFATFFPSQFFNIETILIEKAERKIDNYFNIE